MWHIWGETARELSLSFSPSQHKPTFCFSTKCNFLVSRSHLHLLIFIWILIVGGWWSEEVVSRSGRLMENMHFLIAISFGKAPALIGVSRAIITLFLLAPPWPNDWIKGERNEICIKNPLIIIFSWLHYLKRFRSLFCFLSIWVLLLKTFCRSDLSKTSISADCIESEDAVLRYNSIKFEPNEKQNLVENHIFRSFSSMLNYLRVREDRYTQITLTRNGINLERGIAGN